VSIVGGIAVLPTYLQARYEAVGEAGAVAPGQLLIASDAARFTAWGAAIQMFEDRPITGQGFLSYQVLHESYGDPILRSPHNEWLRLFAEEGIVVGLLGVAFIVTTAGALAGVRGALGAGALGGFLGFVTAATFNNPFLFVQVMAIACTIVGIVVGRGLASARGAPIGAVPGLDASATKNVQPRDNEGQVDDGERAQERE
jgi:O-antigen ligase